MENGRKTFTISQKHLRAAIGIFICLISVVLMLNYDIVTQFIFWCFSFFVGSFFTYLLYVVFLIYGLSKIVNKSFAIKNLRFATVGLIVLSIGVLIVTTCCIAYSGDKYITFSNFKEIYILSLNLSNFPKLEFNQSGGLIGYILVSILNSAFTNIGTNVVGGVLIVAGIVLILLRPFMSLIKSKSDLQKKEDKNEVAMADVNDEKLLLEENISLSRVVSEIDEEIVPTDNLDELANQDIHKLSSTKLNFKISDAIDEVKEKEIQEETRDDENSNVDNRAYVLQTNGLVKAKFDPFGEENNELMSDLIYQRNVNKNRQEKIENKTSFVENNVKENYINNQNNIEQDEFFEEKAVLDNDLNMQVNQDTFDADKNDDYFVQESIQEEINGDNNDNLSIADKTVFETKNIVETKQVVKPIQRKKTNYVVPPLDLLSDLKSEEADQKNYLECEERKLRLNEILEEFNFGAKIVSYKIGPSVTRYDLLTNKSVSISGIEKYLKDISIKLGGISLRFTPVVQGKSTSGIEIANSHRSTVSFKDIFEHLKPKEDGKLFIPFGKNISGDYLQADLAEFPHMLIAGTTGSGKSIFVHSIIMSLIMRSSMDELKLVMIDPKRVEFSKYRDIPHLLCPIITEPEEAVATLNRLAVEMDDRYDSFGAYGLSTINEYNEYAKENNLPIMPRIIVVIDEFADLMETNSAVASPVTRIGAKARASGIHMIIATQRPSVDVITGKIKGNLNVRVALSTASVNDSIVVLGESGAEKLLGKGDMLVSCPEISKSEKVRAQGCFIENKEIIKITNYLKERYPLEYDDRFVNLLDKARLEAKDFGTIHPSNGEDEKYEEIKKFIMESKDYVSKAMIAREFNVGFNRSKDIYDRLVREKIIEENVAANSSKGAKVLVHIGGYHSPNSDDQPTNPGSYSQSSFESK